MLNLSTVQLNVLRFSIYSVEAVPNSPGVPFVVHTSLKNKNISARFCFTLPSILRSNCRRHKTSPCWAKFEDPYVDPWNTISAYFSVPLHYCFCQGVAQLCCIPNTYWACRDWFGLYHNSKIAILVAAVLTVLRPPCQYCKLLFPYHGKRLDWRIQFTHVWTNESDNP